MAPLFSKPKVPAPTAIGPTGVDPATEAAAADAARREAERLRKRRRGARATIVTGPAGVTQQAPVFRTTLG